MNDFKIYPYYIMLTKEEDEILDKLSKFYELNKKDIIKTAVKKMYNEARYMINGHEKADQGSYNTEN